MSIRQMTVQYIGSMLTTPPLEREVKRIEVGGVTFVPERTCNIIGFDDGVDEGIDGEWHQYSEPQYDLSCGHSSQGTEPPNYCPNCGAKVVSE